MFACVTFFSIPFKLCWTDVIVKRGLVLVFETLCKLLEGLEDDPDNPNLEDARWRALPGSAGELELSFYGGCRVLLPLNTCASLLSCPCESLVTPCLFLRRYLNEKISHHLHTPDNVKPATAVSVDKVRRQPRAYVHLHHFSLPILPSLLSLPFVHSRRVK